MFTQANERLHFYRVRANLEKIIDCFDISVKIHSLFIARTTFCLDEYFDKTTDTLTDANANAFVEFFLNLVNLLNKLK